MVTNQYSLVFVRTEQPHLTDYPLHLHVYHLNISRPGLVAQLVDQWRSVLDVVGSNPARVGDYFLFFIGPISFLLFRRNFFRIFAQHTNLCTLVVDQDDFLSLINTKKITISVL